MIHGAHLGALDRTLEDIKSGNKIMGGITVMFARDFRQTLPVIVRGTRANIVKSCLHQCFSTFFVIGPPKFNVKLSRLPSMDVKAKNK